MRKFQDEKEVEAYINDLNAQIIFYAIFTIGRSRTPPLRTARCISQFIFIII